jgi:hybrid cluster-associated redox disulfide protein
MAELVTKEMSILDIVQKYPQSLEVFAKYGLGCIGCAAARFENLEAGAKVHGFDPDEMIAEINALL